MLSLVFVVQISPGLCILPHGKHVVRPCQQGPPQGSAANMGSLLQTHLTQNYAPRHCRGTPLASPYCWWSTGEEEDVLGEDLQESKLQSRYLASTS